MSSRPEAPVLNVNNNSCLFIYIFKVFSLSHALNLRHVNGIKLVE